MIKIGINGFGRIGRFVFRADATRDAVQVLGVNDVCSVDYLGCLFYSVLLIFYINEAYFRGQN